MSQQKSNRRKKRRSGSSPMPSGGAGLMRFFEDSSIGVKVGPITTVLMAGALILVVVLAHFGVFEWIFSPAGGASG